MRATVEWFGLGSNSRFTWIEEFCLLEHTLTDLDLLRLTWQPWPPSDQYTCFRNKECSGSLKLSWIDLNDLSDKELRFTGNDLARQEVLKLTYTHSHWESLVSSWLQTKSRQFHGSSNQCKEVLMSSSDSKEVHINLSEYNWDQSKSKSVWASQNSVS